MTQNHLKTGLSALNSITWYFVYCFTQNRHIIETKSHIIGFCVVLCIFCVRVTQNNKYIIINNLHCFVSVFLAQWLFWGNIKNIVSVNGIKPPENFYCGTSYILSGASRSSAYKVRCSGAINSLNTTTYRELIKSSDDFLTTSKKLEKLSY